MDEYPDFPQLDGVYYLNGFCLSAMNRHEEAREIFFALTEKYPKSKKAPEAFTRIGEYYFDRSQESVQGISDNPIQWDEAKKYYTIAVEYGPDYLIYDRALYRLAWTNYYKQDYDSMIKGFITLVEFSDRSPKGSSLRAEAVEFMASVLAEEDWNLEDNVIVRPQLRDAPLRQIPQPRPPLRARGPRTSSPKSSPAATTSAPPLKPTPPSSNAPPATPSTLKSTKNTSLPSTSPASARRPSKFKPTSTQPLRKRLRVVPLPRARR
jgi:hypothetical protein